MYEGLVYQLIPVTESMHKLREETHKFALDKWNTLSSSIVNFDGTAQGNFKKSSSKNPKDSIWMKQIFDPEGGSYENGAREQSWSDLSILPALFALRFEKTIFVYNSVTHNTILFYYNRDLEKVQCSAHFKGYVYPLANSVCVLYNNRDHYDWVRPQC